MITNLSIAILLLATNAFFVAAEFALVKLKSFRIDALAETGSRSAQLTKRIHQNLEPYLAACQLGITMASLGLGWVGEPTIAAILEPLLHPLDMSEAMVHTISFVAGFILFSSLHIVVGEQVPKTFAIRKPESVSMWIAYPLRWFYLFIFPLNWLLNAASASILRMFGVAEAPHSEVLSGEEIQGLIETSEKHGNIETERAVMMQNLFAFDSRTVEEIMVPRGNTAYIDLQDSWNTQFETLSKIEHSRFPVVDGGDQNLTGVVLVKDFYRLVLSGETELEQSLKKIIREPLVVPESQSIGLLFETMRTSQQHMAVVIDEYGSFAGVVTMEDMLEEIVGEIADELDQVAGDVTLTKNGEFWEGSGWTQLGDIERSLQLQFEEEVDANTLSGLFMYRLTRIPEVGDSIVEQGFRFTVESMTGHRVDLAKIEVVHPSEEGAEQN